MALLAWACFSVSAEEKGADLLRALEAALQVPDPGAQQAGAGPDFPPVLESGGAPGLLTREERERRRREALDEVDSTFRTAAEALRSARQSADLDAVMAVLWRLETMEDRRLDRTWMMLPPAGPVRKFVLAWQDVLEAMESGDLETAWAGLEQLGRGPSPAPHLDPLELLPLLREVFPVEAPQPEQLVERLQRLEDMDEALRGWSKFPVWSDEPGDLRRFRRHELELGWMATAYRRHLAGLRISHLGQLSKRDLGEDELLEPLRRLYEQFQLLILPAAVGAPAGTVAREGETLEELFKRLEQAAQERFDPLGVFKARLVFQKIGFNPDYPRSIADLAAAKALAAARQQEGAGQHLLAVISLEDYLESGSDLVDPEQVRERVASIQAAHPDAFDQARRRLSGAAAATASPSP